MLILRCPWFTQRQVKQSLVTHFQCMTPQQQRCGRLRLAKTLAVWHRAMTRQVKQAQIWCSSWHGKKLMRQKQQGENGLTPALWLTFDHKKTIQIKFALRWVATLSTIRATHPHKQWTSPCQSSSGTACWAPMGQNICTLIQNKIYLNAALEYFEYMKILLALFP